MADNQHPKRFYGKTWIFYVQVFILGTFGVFSLLMSLLFHFNLIKPADGKPHEDAVMPLFIIGSIFLYIAVQAYCKILVRRKPVLSICREGVFLVIGKATIFNKIPLLGGLLSELAFQNVRTQILYAPWDTLKYVSVEGMAMRHLLFLFGDIYRFQNDQNSPFSPISDRIFLHEAYFDSSLQMIVTSINHYLLNAELRTELPSYSM